MRDCNATAAFYGGYDLLFKHDHSVLMSSSVIAVAFDFCHRNQSDSC